MAHVESATPYVGPRTSRLHVATFSPLFLEMYMGQVSFWAASALYLAVTDPAEPTVEPSRFSVGNFHSVKPNMLILLPALVRLRQYRTLIIGLGGSMLASIPHFLIHPNASCSFIQTNFHAGHFKGVLTHAGNIGLWGSLVSLGAHYARAPLNSSSLLDLPFWAAAPAYIAPPICGLFTLLYPGVPEAKIARFTSACG